MECLLKLEYKDWPVFLDGLGPEGRKEVLEGQLFLDEIIDAMHGLRDRDEERGKLLGYFPAEARLALAVRAGDLGMHRLYFELKGDPLPKGVLQSAGLSEEVSYPPSIYTFKQIAFRVDIFL